MVTFFRQALTLLTTGERRGIYLILISSAIAGAVHTLSILSIMPFIVLLTNPDMLQTNELLQRVHSLVGADSYRELLTIVGGFAILVLIVGNLFVSFEQWFSLRFLNGLGQKVQRRVLEKILLKPYEYILANHSAKLSDVVLSQVERVMDGVIGTFISVCSGVALAGLIVLMLLIISLKTTLLALAGLLVAYLIVFMLLRRRVETDGEELTRLSASVFTAVKEALDGIREIRTRRAESFFGDRFGASSLRMSKLATHHVMMNFLPHYLLETAIFAGLVAVALYFIFTTADAGVTLSYIALYGMAVYRLIPSLQSVFEGISTVHHNADAVQVVTGLYSDQSPDVEPRHLPKLARQIRLADVSYRYAGSERSQLQGINLSIPAGSSVCLFGPSGSGKTTILNLIAGLTFPQRGQVLCDDLAVGPETVNSWREQIGYSPQQSYFFADTLASNIAFGVAAQAIDQQRVVEVAKLANLHDFVSAQLPQAYQSLVAEHGDTFSGGQRQRVGIARSLYHDPAVFLFDESFASLDAENRTVILDNLFALKNKTLVFASHETAVACRCDKIIVIEHGKLIAQGSYEQLLQESPRFVEILSRLDLADQEQGESSRC